MAGETPFTVGQHVPSTVDLIVVGSGIAGLYAALLAAPHGRVLLVTKGALEESNTRHAQGGIAVALDPGDSPELHLRDTIAAGDGLCDRSMVAILTREAPDCILDLLDRGVPFDRDGEALAWTLEAAHSLPRVLHAGGDATGASVERTLAACVRAAGVTVLEHALCTDLILSGGRVTGIRLLLAGGEITHVDASNVILATGGAGRVFRRTTNPAVATGDGLAAAYRAGAELMDLEFFQFHPTALVLEGAPSFLISEAVRGEGGVLRDAGGQAFMAGYHPDRELAPRDIVARAIHSQMERSGSAHVWLDITHLDPGRVERRFPSILRFCRAHGVDPVRDLIPVAPAAHYFMGGIRTDSRGRTSLPGLFACGEAACTGVHGANRLASNSLLEGLVFARRAIQSIVEGGRDQIHDPGGPDVSTALPTGRRVLPAGFHTALADAMWSHASVVRSEESLLAAHIEIVRHPLCESEPTTREELETANLALVAELLLTSALARRESRGAHFRTDFPERDAGWRRHIVISRDGAWLTPLSVPAAMGAVHG